MLLSIITGGHFCLGEFEPSRGQLERSPCPEQELVVAVYPMIGF